MIWSNCKNVADDEKEWSRHRWRSIDTCKRIRNPASCKIRYARAETVDASGPDCWQVEDMLWGVGVCL